MGQDGIVQVGANQVSAAQVGALQLGTAQHQRRRENAERAKRIARIARIAPQPAAKPAAALEVPRPVWGQEKPPTPTAPESGSRAFRRGHAAADRAAEVMDRRIAAEREKTNALRKIDAANLVFKSSLTPGQLRADTASDFNELPSPSWPR